jgi:hypothetical protein
MNAPAPSSLLRPVLRILGLIFIVGIPLLNRIWPSGWAWVPEQPAYLHMIWGIYATLGVFLLIAARDPARHLSLIWFTVWSSVVHGTVMAVHSLTDPGQRGHLGGDVAALFLTAVVLTVLVRQELRAGASA